MVNLTTNTNKPSVATPSSAYNIMAEAWKLPEILLTGTAGIRKESNTYLPRYPKESDPAYLERQKRSVLYSVYQRSLQTYAGLAFNRSVVVSDLPQELEYIKEDTDSLNTSLSSFGYDLLHDTIHFGLTHFLVEFPFFDEDNTPSLADMEEQKIRPYWVHISPTNLIGWRTELEGGLVKISQIRILESETVEDGEFGEQVLNSVRVITPDTISIYTANTKGEYPEEATKTWPNSLGYVPLVTIYGDKTGFLQGKPTLSGLADLNLRHYQKLSDLDNIERMVCTPLLAATGVEAGALDGIDVGPGKLVSLSDPSSKLFYVEPTGGGIPHNQKSIENIEKRMGSLGGDLVLKQQAADRVTATARKIDQSESISILQVMIDRLEVALERGITISADYIELDKPKTNISIGDALTAPNGNNMIDYLVQYLLDNDGMDINQAANELKRRGHITENYDVKDTVPKPKEPNPNSETLEDNNEDEINKEDENDKP